MSTWDGTPELGDSGAPPANSPAIVSVTGDATGLIVMIEPILPTTLVDFLINGVTVAANQRTMVIKLTTDGTNPLVVDTDYTVTVQAHNGVSPDPAPSTGVTARLDPGMTTTEVVAILAAGTVITGALYFGANGVLDSSGLRATGPDGRQTIIGFDGSGNQFVGQAILDSLIANGNMTINGLTNNLNGLLTLGSGVSDPTTKPGVASAGWDSVTNTSGAAYGTLPRGLFYNGTNWIYVDSVLYSGSVSVINKGTGARTVLATMPTNFGPYGGVVQIGSSWYVLGRDGARSGNWWVYVFNTSWVKTGEWSPTASSNDSLAIGIDGAGLLIAKRLASNGNLSVNAYTTAGVAGTSVACGTFVSETITGVFKAAVDTATVRFVVTSTAAIRVFDTSTGARVTLEEWTPAASPLGIGNDGTNWFTLDMAKVWKYTNLIGYRDFTFTWVDNDAGGSGIAETKKSTLNTVAPTKRSKWTISLPSPPPDDGTTDGANTANLYAATVGGTQVLQTNLVEGTYSATYSTLATSGSAPPSTNGFAARPGAVGSIASTATDGTGPLWKFNGDGTWDIATMTRAWTSYIPVLTGSTTNPVLGTGGVQFGRYQRVGTTVRFRLRITFGGSGATFGSGSYLVSLPVPMLDASAHRFTGGVRDNSAGNEYMIVSRGSTLSVVGLNTIGTNGLQGGVTPTAPFTFDVNDYVELAGQYECSP